MSMFNRVKSSRTVFLAQRVQNDLNVSKAAVELSMRHFILCATFVSIKYRHKHFDSALS